MTQTKPEELLCPFPDELLADPFPEPVPLTPEQLALVAEVEERHTKRQVEWDEIISELQDNSKAVFRAMRRCRRESEQDQVERVAASTGTGRSCSTGWAPGLLATRTSPWSCSICDVG